MKNLKYIIISGFVLIIIGSYWIYLDFVPETPYIDISTLAPSEVEGWKTYRNEQYGFEVRYPPKWGVKDLSQNNTEPGIYFETKDSLFAIFPKGSLHYSVLDSAEVKNFSLQVGSKPAVGYKHYDDNQNLYLIRVVFDPPLSAQELLKIDIYGSAHASDLNNDTEMLESFLKILSTFKFIPSIGSGQAN